MHLGGINALRSWLIEHIKVIRHHLAVLFWGDLRCMQNMGLPENGVAQLPWFPGHTPGSAAGWIAVVPYSYHFLAGCQDMLIFYKILTATV